VTETTTTTDATTRSNAGAVTLDAAALDAWIGDQLPGAGSPLTAARLGAATGIANALFLLERGGHRWVFRQPPPVKNDPSASDTVREWRILRALEGTPVPHPQPLLLCTDLSVLERPFMIMALVDGFTPGFEIPEPFLSDHALRFDLGMAYAQGCALLSQVDWVAGGLEGLGKPDGFLERQVRRWMAQLERYQVRPLTGIDFLAGWLEANRPAMGPAGIIHGDYSPFNVMIAPDPPSRLAAIVDWDTGTIGDPLLDIGHLLARWTEPGEEAVLGEQAGGTDGYPTRRQLAAHYQQLTGRDMTALPYFEALALFKLAVILEGTFARQRHAGVPDDENMMVDTVPRLLRFASEFARGERI
jgi:aminoglycoside phosphotransferase (APT) family kinase protein